MDAMEIPSSKTLHHIKLGKLVNTTIESKLGHFFPTKDNHRRWKWELHGPSNIVENIFLFGLYQQKHFVVNSTSTNRHLLSITSNEYTTQQVNNKVGYPLQPFKKANGIQSFWKPLSPNATYDLRKGKTEFRQRFLEGLLKVIDSRDLSELEIIHMPNKRITIGVVSSQWGERTKYGWSVCFRNGNERPFFGCDTGSVQKTTSFSEQIFSELYATRAALTFLRIQINSIWTIHPLRLTVLSTHDATIATLTKLHKTNTHNQ
jgi:hypothetical protein